MSLWLNPTQTDFGQQEHNVRCYHTFQSGTTNQPTDGSPAGLTVTGLTGGWTDGTYNGTSTGSINITYGNRGLVTSEDWEYVPSGKGGDEWVQAVTDANDVPIGSDLTKMATTGIYHETVYWQVHAWTNGIGTAYTSGGDPYPIPVPVQHIYRTYNKEIFYNLDDIKDDLVWLTHR